YSSRRRHTTSKRDWSSDVCSSDLNAIDCSNNLEKCVKDCTMVVFAVPSHALREVAHKVKPFIICNEISVNVAKGIENDTFMTMSDRKSVVEETDISYECRCEWSK